MTATTPEPEPYRDPSPTEAMRTARLALLLAIAALPGSIVGIAVLLTTAATAWAVAFF